MKFEKQCEKQMVTVCQPQPSYGPSYHSVQHCKEVLIYRAACIDNLYLYSMYLYLFLYLYDVYLSPRSAKRPATTFPPWSQGQSRSRSPCLNLTRDVKIGKLTFIYIEEKRKLQINTKAPTSTEMWKQVWKRGNFKCWKKIQILQTHQRCETRFEKEEISKVERK